MSTFLATLPPTEAPKNAALSFADDVFAEMRRIDDDIARSAFGLFQGRSSVPGFALDDWLKAESSILEPLSVSVEDVGDKLRVRAKVPGFPEKDLRVHVNHNSVLHICGRTEETKKKGKGTRISMRSIRSTVSLPTQVESKGVFFTVENGVMTLLLSKVKDAQASIAKTT
jgi:HSP20 family molecular chaperone IbpA